MSFMWRRIANPAFNVLRREFNPIEQHTLSKNYVNTTATTSNIYYLKPLYVPVRSKSKKSSSDSDDEDIIFDDDASLSKDSKVVKFNTTSMRTDIILKSALSVARNKIETLFYESKIRINGKKILKKSASVRIGDEIDVIKMVSPKNSDHIYVARVEVLSAAAKEESILVTVRRFKNLLIENYEIDPYKGGSES